MKQESTLVKQVGEMLGRLGIITILMSGVGGVILQERYKSYWGKTIYRVQTVDFNILSHMLPTKLSYALINQDDAELQRTLDSNYSLFGLVVTDLTGQKIITYSGKGSKSRSWSKNLTPKKLEKQPYDLLLNPPPINPQWSYESSRARERKATDFTNKGQVIGRVYYLRGEPPNLTQEFQRWLRNPFSTSDPIDTYTLAMITSWISGVAFWSVLEFLMYRKDVKEAQQKENQRRLSQQNTTLQLQLKERINDINRLKTSYENEIKRRDIQIQSLTCKNQQLETEISETTKALEAQKRQEENLQSKLEFYTNQEQSQQQQINELNGLITNYEIQLKNPASKQKQNQQLQLELTKIKKERSQAESALADYKSQIKQLNQELSINHNGREQLQQQIKYLSQSLEESTQRQQELKLENEKKSAEINSIRKEKEQIEEEIGNRELNQFELRIQKILHNSLNTQSNLIQTHFDVGSGDAGSKFVDFLVITKKSIVVIEAKNYQGEIRARENVRNSNWISRDNRLNIDRNINSCWGTNPYQQVKNYIDAVMKKVNRMRPRVKIYGLVVFPNNAQISEEITQNIPANYYRVIKSNQILETIRELDNLPSSNSRFQNPQQIFNTYFNQ